MPNTQSPTDVSPATIAAVIDAIDYSGLSVQPDYIDPNGHMNVGYYTLLFDKALDLPWARLGIYSAMLLAQSGKSSFALEAHFTYQRELLLGDPLHFTFRLLDFDAKRVHYFMQMLHAKERYVAATFEQLSICVDIKTRRSASWSDNVFELLQALHAEHSTRRVPPEAGHAVGIRRR